MADSGNLLANGDRDRSCIIATDSFAADGPTAAAGDARDLHDRVPCCADGWAAFWVMVVLGSTQNIIGVLMVPDLSTAYFNGGVDPCAGDGRGTPKCDAVVTQVTNLQNVFGTASAIVSLLCNPFVGAAADMWGRRRVMIVSAILGKINVLALLSVAYLDVSIYFLFAASELVAMVPGIVVCNFWVADRTPAHERATVYGRLQASTLLDGVVVPLLTTFLNRDGSSIALVFFATTSLLTLLFGLRESLPKAKRRAQGGTPWHRLCAAFNGVASTFRQPLYRKIMFLNLLGGGAQAGTQAVSFFYFKDQFGTTMQTLGPITALITASNLVVMIWLIKPMERLLGLRMLMITSALFGILACIGWIVADSYTSLLIVSSFAGLSSASNAALTALIVNLATADQGKEIGVSLGTFLSMATIPPIYGPLLFRSVFVFFLQPDNPFGVKIASSPWILAILMNSMYLAIVLRIPRSQFAAVTILPTEG